MSARSFPAGRLLALVTLGAGLLTGCTSFVAGAQSTDAAARSSGTAAGTSTDPGAATLTTGTARTTAKAPTATATRVTRSTASASEPSRVATDAPRPTGSKPTVVVTYSDWDAGKSSVVVGAYVPDLVEDGGTCTLRLTHDGAAVTATSPGAADVSTTDCTGLSIAGEDLTSGDWRGTVSYSSSAGSASSAAFSVSVP